MLEVIQGDDGIVRVVPDPVMITFWRHIISMTYTHPALLCHPDLAPFRQIFIENKVIHKSESLEIFLPNPTRDPKLLPSPHPPLRPYIRPPFAPINLIFGKVLSFSIDEDGITIKDFQLCPSMKQGVAELAEFIRWYPKGLFEEPFGFIYDFLIRYGLLPRVVEGWIDNSPVLTIPSDAEEVSEEATPDVVSKKPARKVSKRSAGQVSKRSAGQVSKKSAGQVSKRAAGQVSTKSSEEASEKSSPAQVSRKVSAEFLTKLPVPVSVKLYAAPVPVPPNELAAAVVKMSDGVRRKSLPPKPKRTMLAGSLPAYQLTPQPLQSPLPPPPPMSTNEPPISVPPQQVPPRLPILQDYFTKYNIKPISIKLRDCLKNPAFEKYLDKDIGSKVREVTTHNGGEKKACTSTSRDERDCRVVKVKRKARQVPLQEPTHPKIKRFRKLSSSSSTSNSTTMSTSSTTSFSSLTSTASASTSSTSSTTSYTSSGSSARTKRSSKSSSSGQSSGAKTAGRSPSKNRKMPISPEIQMELGNDCTESFLQRLITTFHEVEQSEREEGTCLSSISTTTVAITKPPPNHFENDEPPSVSTAAAEIIPKSKSPPNGFEIQEPPPMSTTVTIPRPSETREQPSGSTTTVVTAVEEPPKPLPTIKSFKIQVPRPISKVTVSKPLKKTPNGLCNGLRHKPLPARELVIRLHRIEATPSPSPTFQARPEGLEQVVCCEVRKGSNPKVIVQPVNAPMEVAEMNFGNGFVLGSSSLPAGRPPSPSPDLHSSSSLADVFL